ncbi:MAG: sigma-70 family RNA polymerase sigma factor [Phycisphaerae bacterium]|nr:sigma-70 family RNA polymerase sigma factor [Phycisphaerae bacterium]
MSDEIRQMIAQARAGRADGFEQIVSAFGPRLYGFFVRATGNHHEAEDLLGELMVRLVKTIQSYDDRGRFEPWLFRIASNLIRDNIRRRQVRSVVVAMHSSDGESSIEDELPAATEAVDAPALAAEESRRLWAALDRLDDTTREMVLLRHFSELSFQEIADLFGCPLGTALAKVHRGLRTLREMLTSPEAATKNDKRK